jgi:undecaprenyl-diphosphatase
MEKRYGFLFSILAVIFVISLFFDQMFLNFVSESKILNEILSFLFGWEVIFVLFFALAVYFYIKDRKTLIPLAVSLFSSMAVAFLLKLIIQRPRYFIEKLYPIIHLPDYSFPSMHTIAVFSLLPILFLKAKRLRWLWLSYAILVGISRILLKQHYLSDVIGAVLIGILVGGTIILLNPRLFEHKKRKVLRKKMR